MKHCRNRSFFFSSALNTKVESLISKIQKSTFTSNMNKKLFLRSYKTNLPLCQSKIKTRPFWEKTEKLESEKNKLVTPQSCLPGKHIQSLLFFLRYRYPVVTPHLGETPLLFIPPIGYCGFASFRGGPS